MENLKITSNRHGSFLSKGHEKMSTDIIQADGVIKTKLVFVNQKPYLSLDLNTGLIHLNPVPVRVETEMSESGLIYTRKEYEIVEPREVKRKKRISLIKGDGLVVTNEFGDILYNQGCTWEHARLRDYQLHEVFVNKMTQEGNKNCEFFEGSNLINTEEYVKIYSKEYQLD